MATAKENMEALDYQSERIKQAEKIIRNEIKRLRSKPPEEGEMSVLEFDQLHAFARLFASRPRSCGSGKEEDKSPTEIIADPLCITPPPERISPEDRALWEHYFFRMEMRLETLRSELETVKTAKRDITKTDSAARSEIVERLTDGEPLACIPEQDQNNPAGYFWVAMA